MFQGKNFGKRVVIVILAVVMMGFALSWLVLVDMGTDPFTCMNIGFSRHFHMSIGNWQAILNIILFILVVIFGRKNIGIGTVANMFLVGYSLDFFSWVWSKVLPEGLFSSMVVRFVVLFPALIVFIFAAAVYMDVKLGTAPFDALSFILSEHIKKVPFRIVRIIYDCCTVLIAFLLGEKIGIVTILMAFTLGPVISFVGKKLEKFVSDGEETE